MPEGGDAGSALGDKRAVPVFVSQISAQRMQYAFHVRQCYRVSTMRMLNRLRIGERVPLGHRREGRATSIAHWGQRVDYTLLPVR